jgi:PAS domain S-box-containing protein
VLVVEDEGLIAHDIAARLESLGHRVVATVSTAEKAIEKAPEADLVLMDIRLDGRSDGVDAAVAIRERCQTPVLFLTAHADKATLERAKKAEPLGYIVKPLAPATLSSSIEIAMHKHRMQRALEARETRLRTIFGSVADAVIVTDVHGRLLMMNGAAERLTGVTLERAAGNPIGKVVKLVNEEAGEDASDPVTLAILRDSVVTLEPSWKLIGADGKELSMEGSAAPLRGPANKGYDTSGATVVLGAVLTLRDVSLRRWRERQVQQANKLDAASRLAFGISSDYANLLATIRARTEQLREHLGAHSAANAPVEEIYAAAIAAEELNGRLNAFSTRQVEKQEIVTLNGILRRAHKLIGSMTGDRIEVKLNIDAAAGRIKADAAKLEQALVAMVLHACGRMPEGGSLLIETGSIAVPIARQEQMYAMLAITHSGEELEPERLFDPVSAGENGLALSMVHAIVREHDGFVSAQAVSGGCRMELLLPRIVSAEKNLIADAASRATVLLASGSEHMQAELHNFFEVNGFNLMEATGKEEALAIAEVHEGPIDVAIGEKAEAIAAELRVAYPKLRVLEIVDVARGRNQIGAVFTEQELLDRVRELVAAEG